jgi:D-amino-acid oxidase
VIKHGGSFYRARLARWQDAIRAVPGPPAAAQIQHIVINCTGNGAGTLGGIEDSKCYPTRGQTVLVRCPGFNRTYTRLRSK